MPHLQFNCSDFGFQNLFVNKVINVTYDNIIVRTKRLNADVSSELLQIEIFNMIQYCYQYFFNLKATPLNSNFLEKLDLISLLVERTEVRSNLQIGKQNAYEWKIIFFSDFPSVFEIYFPTLKFENFLFISTAKYFNENKNENYEYENINNNTNNRLVKISVRKIEIIPIFIFIFIPIFIVILIS